MELPNLIKYSTMNYTEELLSSTISYIITPRPAPESLSSEGTNHFANSASSKAFYLGPAANYSHLEPNQLLTERGYFVAATFLLLISIFGIFNNSAVLIVMATNKQVLLVF